MAKDILHLFETAPINLNKDKNDNMKQSVRDIIRYISDNALTGEKVPRQIVQVALRNLCLVVGSLGRHHGEQQDANEFYMQALSPLAHDLGEKLEVSQMFTCIDCGRQSTKNVSHLQNLCLTIPKKPGIKMSVSQLLKDYFEHDIIEKCSCGGLLDFQQKLLDVPNTLVVTVNRFEYDVKRHHCRKNELSIQPDKSIDLTPYTDTLQNVKYALRGAVCHHGRSIHSGHYTAFIHKDGHFAKISDTDITLGSESELSKGSYFLFYDRIQPPLPLYTNSILQCLGNTKGFRSALASFDKISTQKCTTMMEGIRDGKALNHETLDLLKCTIAQASHCQMSDVPEKFIKQLLEGLLGKASNCNTFKIASEIVVSCNSCKKKSVVPETLYAVLTPLSFSCNDIANSLCLKQACPLCSSKRVDCTSYVSWLPETMCIATNKMATTENLQLDLEEFVNTTIPLISSSYKLQTLLAHDNGEYINIINEKGSLFIKNSIGKLVPFESSKLKGMDIISCFYDRVQKQVLLKYIPQKTSSPSKLSVLHIPEQNVTEQEANRP